MSEANVNDAKNKKDARTAADVKRTRITILVAAIVVVAVGLIAGIAIYQNRVRPFNAVIVAVDDSEVDMRYFLKRLAMSGEQSFSMLSTLSEELLLRKVAPQPPYNIEVTEDDIDQLAMDVAKGDAEDISEPEFREWYRQQINETRFSEEEFRTLLKTTLLAQRMTEYLSDRVPETAEQVFLHMIQVKDVPAGREVKERYDAGEDFAALAEEYSVDQQLAESGGEFGWFPKAALSDALSYAAFDLEVGECSDPFFIGDLDNETAVVIMVSEKDPNRILDERSLEAVKAAALEDWFLEEFDNHSVEFYGLDRTTGYDSGTDAWVNWQLMRMKRNEEDQQAEQAG